MRDGAHDAGRNADAGIDHRHREQITAEVHLDFVEDLQHSQPRIAVGEVHDQRTAQVFPARDEQQQRREEQQEFGEGRRQEFERRLDPLKFRHLKRRQRIGYANHALQLLP